MGRHSSRAGIFPGTTHLPPVGKQVCGGLAPAPQLERCKAGGLLPKLETKAPHTRVLGRGWAARQSQRPCPSRPINEPRAEGGACQLGAPRAAAETVGGAP